MTLTYKQQAERAFIPPVSVTAGRLLREERRVQILNIHAQLEAAGPVAVGTDWHSRMVDARCRAAADLIVLDDWLAAPRSLHDDGCRCQDCTIQTWGRAR